jgi:hypothetical protein
MDCKKLNNKSLAKKINVAESTLSIAITQNKLSSSKVIALTLEAFPELSAEWLIRGKGNMIIENFEFKEPKVNYLTKEDLFDFRILVEKVRELDHIVRKLEDKIK